MLLNPYQALWLKQHGGRTAADVSEGEGGLYVNMGVPDGPPHTKRVYLPYHEEV